jgi:VWFA-related protein
VLLDVVVRDAHGHFITNLKPGEVTVYEDGVRQDMRSFRLVAGSEVRFEDQKQAADAQAAGTRLAGSNSKLPPVNPLRTVNAVCLILNDLNPETRAFAFDAARKFVSQELRPNTFIGVFSLDSSGLRPVFPFSNNRERLLKAVELAAINQLPSINLGTAAMFNGLSVSLTGGAATAPSAVGVADGASVANPLGTRGEMGLSVNAGLREIDALIGLVRQLGSMPFQKTVVLLGTGLTRPPDQLEYWNSLIHQATNNGVTFYAMDVYGLGVCQGDTDPDCVAHSAMAPSAAMLPYVAALSKQQGPASLGQATDVVSPASSGQPAALAAASAAAQGPPSASPTAQTMELAHQDDYLKFMVSSANRQEAIRELAELTGGFLIANTNNTDKLLARVMEEVDTHYEIAYPPASERDDGHFRKIEVKLARPDLRAETRNGYFAVPDTGAGPVTPEEMAGLRALDTRPRPRTFGFLARAYRFRDASGTAQYAIAFELPISNLTATRVETGDKRRLHASLLALVKDAQGQIVDRVSKDVSSELSADQVAAVQADRMTYEHAVNLAPGRYTVEAAVVDHEGNRASTTVLEIDNREQPALGLSDITLVRRLENLDRPPDAADPFQYTGKRVLPTVSTDLAAGAQPSVYFVVYPEPGNPAMPDVRVQLLKDGRLYATSTPELLLPDSSGDIPVVIPEANDPGRYEVKVKVVEGRISTERSLTYTVAGEIPIPGPPKGAITTAEVRNLPQVDSGLVSRQSPDDPELARFKEKVRQDMTTLPNYTCLETIARGRRAPPLRDFLPLDTVHLEVSSVAGKELFARPGAQHFEDRDVTSLVASGAIGSGMFASIARNLFVVGKGTRKYKGKQNLAGRASVRYDFRLTKQESGFKIQVANYSEMVAAKGSFWFDPVSLDLLRLEVYGEDIPDSLRLDEAVIRNSYARARIGVSDALLPQRSEVTMTYFSGVTNRNVIEFSRCREYGAESKINFDAPPAPVPEVPKQ